MRAWFSPPAPVTVAVHGVCGAPVKVKGPDAHVTNVVDAARPTVSVGGGDWAELSLALMPVDPL